ncbi:uncharacterized protein LOC124708363 [Lolium rigidum]|uniref:uncharacterized protein LOC124708363 n=1 Tax=Lolium rigidum TaxID=89674 RepID=UPI001F5D3237|nr:uncharacterized protein LOC124708363 [Lolium rigidum]
METATLTISSRCLAAAAASHGAHRRAAAEIVPRAGAKLRPQVRRLRALPPELSEILAPKLVPGSPADTGDFSAIIPISAVMLLFYFVTNWVFPAVIMKGMQPNAEDEAAAAEATPMDSSSLPQGSDAAANGKVKKRRKRRRKAATEA